MTSGRLAANEVGTALGSRRACKVRRLIGSGGQGEVYAVDVDGDGLALKWYYPQLATPEQREALRALVETGPPNGRFLWPLDLVEFKNRPGFGYLMALRDGRYKGITDLLARRVVPTFLSLSTAGTYLADGFLQLHARGLCYRDISWGNVFFDSSTGDVLICDNDNVAPNKSGGAGVLGTAKFMAPEVVRGDAKPSTQTDLYSLAVLLFLMLINHHPLDGRREATIRCFDAAAMQHLYGTQPLFIFDPSDRSNAPEPGYQDNALIYWALYPQFLRDLFTRSFTNGIADPEHGRVRETTWRSAMGRLRDAVCYCRCGAQNFFEESRLTPGGALGPCWRCRSPIPAPFRILLTDRGEPREVVLNHDSKLFAHHVDPGVDPDFTRPIAEVRQNPTDPTTWGLCNLTADQWTAFLPDQSIRAVKPGQSLALRVGTKVQIATCSGEIQR